MPSHSRRPARTTVTVWNCCYCGAGAMLYSSTPICTTCDHQRCTYCHVYSAPVSEGYTTRKLNEENVPAIRGTAASQKGKRHVETPQRADPTPRQKSKAAAPQQRKSPQTRDLMRDLLDMKESSNRHGRDPGIVDTYRTDTETVYSTTSSATTLVDPGAVEAFARNIMTFQSLGCLWPQLIERCDTEERCIYVIERLLKRYARDLALVSPEMHGSKMSDNRLCHAAARFVRKSRLQIARKIWEAQALGLDNSEGKDTMYSLSGIEVPNLEVDEDDDEPTDGDLLFETIEETLYDKGPIFSLQANIKLLVNLSNSTDDGIVYRLSTSLNTSIRNAISSLYEPHLSPGHTRLRYTCRCGRRLYDDFKEIQPGALNNLEKLLASYFSDHPVTLEPGDFEPSATPASPNRNKVLGGLMSVWDYLSGGRQKDARLPWTRRPTDDIRLGFCSTGTTNVRVNHNFVLLCLPFMQWAKKLHQLDTCNMQSDQAFFLSLRQQYAVVRKSRPWMSFQRFRRLHSLHFVKFEVYKQELVDIHDTPSVPDREDVLEAERNYSYDPLPAQTNPPIGSQLLMHLFQNPDHANTEPILYRKIPKKVRCRLEACPVKGSAVGWGVHFGEGVNGRALFAFGCIGFFCALVFGVAWSKAHDDIQSGFAIGGFMVTFLGFCLAIARLEIQFEL